MTNPADSQLEYLRVPHSIEAEQSVLGGLLLDNSAWDRIADVLIEEDFYRHDHRLIWHHIARLIGLARPADVITVNESLVSAGKAEDAGGLAYLNALAHNTPSAANIRRYGEIVRARHAAQAGVDRRRDLVGGHEPAGQGSAPAAGRSRIQGLPDRAGSAARPASRKSSRC